MKPFIAVALCLAALPTAHAAETVIWSQDLTFDVGRVPPELLEPMSLVSYPDFNDGGLRMQFNVTDPTRPGSGILGRRATLTMEDVGRTFTANLLNAKLFTDDWIKFTAYVENFWPDDERVEFFDDIGFWYVRWWSGTHLESFGSVGDVPSDVIVCCNGSGWVGSDSPVVTHLDFTLTDWSMHSDGRTYVTWRHELWADVVPAPSCWLLSTLALFSFVLFHQQRRTP